MRVKRLWARVRRLLGFAPKPPPLPRRCRMPREEDDHPCVRLFAFLAEDTRIDELLRDMRSQEQRSQEQLDRMQAKMSEMQRR